MGVGCGGGVADAVRDVHGDVAAVSCDSGVESKELGSCQTVGRVELLSDSIAGVARFGGVVLGAVDIAAGGV